MPVKARLPLHASTIAFAAGLGIKRIGCRWSAIQSNRPLLLYRQATSPRSVTTATWAWSRLQFWTKPARRSRSHPQVSSNHSSPVTSIAENVLRSGNSGSRTFAAMGASARAQASIRSDNLINYM